MVKKSIDGESRNYVELKLEKGKVAKRTKKEVYGADKNKLFPTDTGLVVTDFLVEYRCV